MKPTKEQIDADLQRRKRLVLQHISRAKDHLNEACSLLSPIIGKVRDWERLGKLSDRVGAEWHRQERGRDGAGLDEAGLSALVELLEQKGGPQC